MKHVKAFENIDAYMNAGGTEEGYLDSPEYFIETYFNGQFGQLGRMLAKFKEQGKMKELISYMDETMEPQDVNDLKNWMLEN